MKQWSETHPKAGLMARKRAAILSAAREAFMQFGYCGTSMEAIAAAAGVSIMTLYRHADSKDDLFTAVIVDACDPESEAEQARLADLTGRPLHEVLVATGVYAQARLADPTTVKLLRSVMAETTRFPQLAETAYRGFVGHIEDMVANTLAMRPESARLPRSARRRLAILFIDGLFGADMLRVLLGLDGLSAAEQARRAERAADEVMAGLGRAAA